MVYEILVPPDAQASDLDLICDNPRAVRSALEILRKQLGDVDFRVRRDGVGITAAELAADEESYEIRAAMEEDSRLPSTYRAGRGGDSDLAAGADGQPHGVWKPQNPEDDYD